MESKVEIGGQVVCWQQCCITNEQGTHKIEPLPLAFLSFLVKHQGQVVSREQLLEAVWHNRQVSDDAIRRVVKVLRTAFGDDAKSPRYIKTLPLQGYMLLAAVNPVSNEVPTSSSNRVTLIKPAIVVLLLVTIIAITALLYRSTSPPQITSTTLNIEKITNLSGAKGGGDFCLENNTLLFVQRTKIDAAQALYSKNLTTNIVKRLTFDDKNIDFSSFSPDCQTIAYRVKGLTGSSSYLAKYSEDGLVDHVMLTHPNQATEVNNRTLLSWSADGKALYYATRRASLKTQDIRAHTPETKNSAVIFKYDISNESWQQVTFSLVEGSGDYLAKESMDGRYLAILRNTEGRRVSILVLDLEKKIIISERHLPFYPANMVWLNNDSKNLAISGGKGHFFYYNILQGTFKEQPNTKINLTNVFYHCGGKCFLMKQHSMNFSDIKEVPNPFEERINASTIHLESQGAYFNPAYSPDGKTIYFTNKNEGEVNLMRKTLAGTEEVLLRYDPKEDVHDLRIGPNEQYATGKLVNRIFILDLNTKAIRFITGQQEQVYFPIFSNDGQHLYFSRSEQEKIVLHRYNLADDTTTTLTEGVYARFDSKKTTDIYLLDNNFSLYKESPDGNRQFITQLGRNVYYSWQVFDNYVYFRKSHYVDGKIHRLDMATGKIEIKRVFENSRSFYFRLSPNGQKILIADYLLLSSEMVKVTWP